MIASGAWVTPAGHQVTMEYRDDTSDWNTIASILTHDEYTMPRGLTGVIVDVGSHIGAFAIGAALDNPEATVIAIEALPENAALIRRNSDLNAAGVIILERAAGTEGRIRYGSRVSDFEAQHYYIGGGVWQDNPDATIIDVPIVTLGALFVEHGPVAFLKIDCEGCEWSFLDDPGVADIAEIAGEYHPRGGMGPARIRELLEPTHVVTLDDAEPFGPFRAVLR
jgi:FkbM family methyltransferase